MNETQSKANVETHQIAGHTVEIHTFEDRQELRIDGVRKKFLVYEKGYNLADAAFEHPYKSLIDAVKASLQPQKHEKGGK